MNPTKLIAALLTACGVKVMPEHVAQIEAIIPEIPARLNQGVQVINAAVQNADTRLLAIEGRLERIEASLRALESMLTYGKDYKGNESKRIA